MKFIFLILIFPISNLFSQELSVSYNSIYYEINPIYNFKSGVYSITFDDGYQTQFTIGMPILNELNIPGTFYIIKDKTSWEQQQIIEDPGNFMHEIGSHTVTHPELDTCSISEINTEVIDSKKFVQSLKPGLPLTFCYPYGSYNSNVIKIVKENYIGARSTKFGFNDMLSLNKYELKALDFNKYVKIPELTYWVDKAIKEGTWAIEVVHGIDNYGYSAITSFILTQHLNYVKSKSNYLWISTVVDVLKYYTESKNALLTCENCNDSIFELRLEGNLNADIYNHPLSLKLKVPNNWQNINISNGDLLKTIKEDNNTYVLFNAIPNDATIIIKPHTKTEFIKPEFSVLNTTYNPNTDQIDINIESYSNQQLAVLLTDSNGIVYNNTSITLIKGTCNICINSNNISKGLCLLKFTGKNYKEIRKVIKI